MADQRDDDYGWLPDILAEIARIAGLDNAMAVAKAAGGRRVRIPAKIPNNDHEHWLVKACGPAAAMVICKELSVNGSGMLFDIPRGPTSQYVIKRDETRRLIAKLLQEGKSRNEIAGIVGIDRRSVYRNVQALKNDKKHNIPKTGSRQGTLL